MKVTIKNKGKEGDSLCFEVVDSKGKSYIIGDCKKKETHGLFKEGYFGSIEGHPAHLNILAEDNIELILKYEDLSEMQ